MIKRTIEISQQPAHLTVRHDQLQISREGELVGSVPCEDVGMLLVDHGATTYTHAALARLCECDAAIVLCGRNHLPAGLLLPLADHGEVVWRVQDQIEVSKPLRKQLWRQIVQAKIRAQAANLPAGPARTKLLVLARNVRSGDPNNSEAQAARLYWPVWSINHRFRRDPDGPQPNGLLNYGYAVVRAALARALVSAGLLPALGIKHSNRSNAFCLADDLIEPLRPIVDLRVRQLFDAGKHDLEPAVKADLLKLLTETVRLNDLTGPLMVSLHRYVASLVRCYQGEADKLEFPEPCESAVTDVCGS